LRLSKITRDLTIDDVPAWISTKRDIDVSTTKKYLNSLETMRKLLNEHDFYLPAFKEVDEKMLSKNPDLKSLWSVYVIFSKLVAPEQIKQVAKAIPNDLDVPLAKKYWQALQTGLSKNGLIYKAKMAKLPVADAELRFQVEASVKGRGKSRKEDVSVVLRSEEIERQLGPAAAVERRSANQGQSSSSAMADEEAEEDRDTFYGAVLQESVFSSEAFHAIDRIFAGHAELMDKPVDLKTVFVGADLPYFCTKNSWDKPEFVGCTVKELPQKFVSYLLKIMANLSGMAIIFGNSNWQIGKIKKLLARSRLSKTSNVTEIMDVYVFRQGYSSRAFQQGDRKSFINNVEVAVQVVFGKPGVDYSGTELLKSRQNLIMVPWERRIKGPDGNTLNTAQKPVIMWDEFLKAVKPDLALDLFAGTGSLSIAAANLGIPFFAVEKDPTMVQSLSDRLSQLLESLDKDENPLSFGKHLYSGLVKKKSFKPQPIQEEDEEVFDEVPGRITADEPLDPKTLTPVRALSGGRDEPGTPTPTQRTRVKKSLVLHAREEEDYDEDEEADEDYIEEEENDDEADDDDFDEHQVGLDEEDDEEDDENQDLKPKRKPSSAAAAPPTGSRHEEDVKPRRKPAAAQRTSSRDEEDLKPIPKPATAAAAPPTAFIQPTVPPQPAGTSRPALSMADLIRPGPARIQPTGPSAPPTSLPAESSTSSASLAVPAESSQSVPPASQPAVPPAPPAESSSSSSQAVIRSAVPPPAPPTAESRSSSAPAESSQRQKRTISSVASSSKPKSKRPKPSGSEEPTSSSGPGSGRQSPPSERRLRQPQFRPAP
jgi:hypothetical protein